MASKKAINFDLDQSDLKKYYDKEPTSAYREIRVFFDKNGFTHRQGSGYVSDKVLEKAEIYDIIKDLGKELSWLSKCAKEIDVTNVGKQYSVKNILASGAEASKADKAMVEIEPQRIFAETGKEYKIKLFDEITYESTPILLPKEQVKISIEDGENRYVTAVSKELGTAHTYGANAKTAKQRLKARALINFKGYDYEKNDNGTRKIS